MWCLFDEQESIIDRNGAISNNDLLATGKISLLRNSSTSSKVEPHACLTALIPALRTSSC
jgi:hypothetical protein